MMGYRGEMNYCPQCGSQLTAKEVDGRQRPACQRCDYVFWNTPVPVVAAVVEWQGKILLARKSEWPPGRWALIAGFPEAGEVLEEAILRELREETGLEGQVLGLIGVYSLPGRNQIFVVYRVKAAGDEVQLGEELEAAREFRADELAPVLENLPPQSGAARALRDWLQLRITS
jgi:NADH pyrophosphatase NudC (nudix superfamily)